MQLKVAKMALCRRRRSFTVEYKIQAVKYLRANNCNVSKTAREYGVERVRIREWNKNYIKLAAENEGDRKKKRKLHVGRRPISIELDNAVYQYYKNELSHDRLVSNKSLKKKALELAKELNISQTFRASDTWLKRWKKRLGIALHKANDSHC